MAPWSHILGESTEKFQCIQQDKTILERMYLLWQKKIIRFTQQEKLALANLFLYSKSVAEMLHRHGKKAIKYSATELHWTAGESKYQKHWKNSTDLPNSKGRANCSALDQKGSSHDRWCSYYRQSALCQSELLSKRSTKSNSMGRLTPVFCSSRKWHSGNHTISS